MKGIVMKLADLTGKKIMLAVSGGLDSCTITHWLVEQGVEVVAYTADLGQPDEKNIEDVRDRMLASGASEMILEDLIDPICRVGLQLVQSQARYEGGYWNTTGIARHVTVAGMLPHATALPVALLIGFAGISGFLMYNVPMFLTQTLDT